jgi:hypothetical protein
MESERRTSLVPLRSSSSSLEKAFGLSGHTSTHARSL